MLAALARPWQFQAPMASDGLDETRSDEDEAMSKAISKVELQKLQDYMRRTFGNAQIKVTARPKKADSAEVMVGDDFVGIISLDDEDGDRSYAFAMAILDTDLEDV
jgi:hypothetical protein